MRRIAVAAAVVALQLTPLPAANAAPAVVTIVAPRSAYVDVWLTRPMSFRVDRATMRGGRTYTAVVIDRLDENPADVVHARFPRVAARAGSDATLGLDPSSSPLPAGRYRLYALSDGPLRFSVRVEGLGRNVTLRPRGTVAPRYRAVDVPQALDPAVGSPYGGITRVGGIEIGSDDLAVARFGAAFRPGVVSSVGWDFCVADAGSECANPPMLDWWQAGVSSEGPTVDGATYLPGDYYPRGSYEVVAKCRALEPAVRCRVAVLDRYVSRAPSRGVVTL